MPENDEKVRRTAAALRNLLPEEHPSAETALAAYVDDTLDPLEREAVEEHLPGCSTCREDVANLESVRGSLLGDPSHVPPRP